MKVQKKILLCIKIVILHKILDFVQYDMDLRLRKV